jgi:hypothetical protein
MNIKLDSQILYFIRDNVADRCSPIQSAPTIEVAKRQMRLLIEKTPSVEKGDFSLMLFQVVSSDIEYDVSEVLYEVSTKVD